MKEAFIIKTMSLHTNPDVVHIETIGLCDEENMIIEWDARSLMEDIPSLYQMCKQAIKQGEEHERKKYKKFSKQLKQDIKNG
jgi:hypothetical protein